VTNRKDEIKYRVNRRGEVVHAEVRPLGDTTPPVGPTPREAARRNTVAALSAEALQRKAEANLQRLAGRRAARQQEREAAIHAAAEKAGPWEDFLSFEPLRAGDIVVPEELQRILDQDRAIGYALRFDWRAFQAISVNRHTVVEADGTERVELTVTDGQHRLYAAQLCFGDDQLVPCLVTSLDNLPQRAALFITLNTERSGLNYNARFKTRLVALDDDATRVERLLLDFGLDWTRPGELRGQPGKVTATNTLEGMVRQAGLSSARYVLGVLKECFGNDPLAYRDYMLAGLWQFCIRYDPYLKRDRLVERLKAVGLEALTDSVPEFKTSINSSSAAAACGAIHYAYNYHLPDKSALPPFSSDATSRYAAIIRRASRDWVVRHEGRQPNGVRSGVYAPGGQVPATGSGKPAIPARPVPPLAAAPSGEGDA